MKDNRFFWMCACAVFFVSFVFVQPGLSASDQPNFIQNFDTDGDGRVSKEEFKGPRDVFSGLDKNRDGYIDKKEAAKAPLPRRGEGTGSVEDDSEDTSVEEDEESGEDTSAEESEATGKPGSRRGAAFIEEYDTDGDGRVSKEEFKGNKFVFGTLDKNRDGYIDKSEAYKAPPPRRAGGSGSDEDDTEYTEDTEESEDEPAEESETSAKPRKPQKGAAFIEEYDTDGDGRVSKEEFKGSRTAFTELDRNRDGYIDKNEAAKGSQRKGKKK